MGETNNIHTLTVYGIQTQRLSSNGQRWEVKSQPPLWWSSSSPTSGVDKCYQWADKRIEPLWGMCSKQLLLYCSCLHHNWMWKCG